MTYEERAAMLRLKAAMLRAAAARLDMAAAAVTTSAAMRDLSGAWGAAEVREIAAHPDLAELNVRFYGA
jgi:hypothetical protein